MKLPNYNVLIDDKNFYHQPFGEPIKKYNEIRKIAIGQGDDYITGCLIDYRYFKDYNQLIAVDLNNQKKVRC